MRAGGAAPRFRGGARARGGGRGEQWKEGGGRGGEGGKRGGGGDGKKDGEIKAALPRLRRYAFVKERKGRGTKTDRQKDRKTDRASLSHSLPPSPLPPEHGRSPMAGSRPQSTAASPALLLMLRIGRGRGERDRSVVGGAGEGTSRGRLYE